MFWNLSTDNAIDTFFLERKVSKNITVPNYNYGEGGMKCNQKIEAPAIFYYIFSSSSSHFINSIRSSTLFILLLLATGLGGSSGLLSGLAASSFPTSLLQLGDFNPEHAVTHLLSLHELEAFKVRQNSALIKIK